MCPTNSRCTRRRHAHVAGQQDVQARGGVPGAGADREQPQLVRGDTGVDQRPAHRLLAQRHRLDLVAAHPALGRPVGHVLEQRTDRGLPGASPRSWRRSAGPARACPRRSAGRRSPSHRSCWTADGGRAVPSPAMVAERSSLVPPHAGAAVYQRGADPSESGSPPSASTPSQSAHTSTWPAAANPPGRRGTAARAGGRGASPRYRPPRASTPPPRPRSCRRAVWPATPSALVSAVPGRLVHPPGRLAHRQVSGGDGGVGPADPGPYGRQMSQLALARTCSTAASTAARATPT